MSDRMLNLLPLMHSAQSNYLLGWRAAEPVFRDDFVARVAAWHTLLAPHSGKNFALYVEDSIEFGAILFAAWHAGKTIWLAPDTLTSSVNALVHSVDAFIGEFPSECLPISCSNTAPQPAVICFSTLNPDFIGLVVHTSGSTGAAQAIPKKLSQLATEVDTLNTLFGAKLAQAEMISTVSHQHIYGLLFKVLLPLTTQRAFHAFSQQYPEQLAQLMATRPCALVSSPAHLKRLPTHLDWRIERSLLSGVFSSGGALPLETVQLMQDLLGQTPVEIYGSSETGGIAWRQRSAEPAAVELAAWTAMPEVTLRSTDNNSLEVLSPHLFEHAWYVTSDCVDLISKNQFHLNGRSDRIVKIEEKRISLERIEQTLLTSPLVDQVKTIVNNDLHNQFQRTYVAVALILTAEGKQFLFEQGKLALNNLLKTILSNEIESVALPRKWRYVDQFPMDQQGKVTQALLLTLFEG